MRLFMSLVGVLILSELSLTTVGAQAVPPARSSNRQAPVVVVVVVPMRMTSTTRQHPRKRQPRRNAGNNAVRTMPGMGMMPGMGAMPMGRQAVRPF